MAAPISQRQRVSCRLATLVATVGTIMAGCGAPAGRGATSDTAVREQIAELGRPAPSAVETAAGVAAGAPEDTVAQLKYAKALADAGRNKEALDVARAAAPTAHENVELASLTGLLQLRLQDASGAEATYRHILARAPEDIEALNGRGIAEIMQGAPNKAELDFRRAAALAPSDTRSENNLALALALEGRTQEAVPMLEAMLKAEPGSDRIRHNLALAYAVAGHRTEAMAVLGAIMSPEESERAVNADMQMVAAHGIAVVAPDHIKAAPGPQL